MSKRAKEKEEEVKAAELSVGEQMLEAILLKEEETKRKIGRAETEAQRVIEEAKLDAAARKRQATGGDVGVELRDRELEKARVEAERISAEIAAQADEIRKKGLQRVDEAIKTVIEGVLPPRAPAD
ncbi:MAG: V-type ATPase subunit subunit G family protein [Actinomycetota bacterium]